MLAMAIPEQDRQELITRYAAMSEGELERVAATGYELSQVAREVLEAEIRRRGLGIILSLPPGIDVYELNETVLLRRFRDLPEALFAKGALDSAGVDSYLVDDNMVRVDWFWSNLLGGVKLMVRPEDVDVANEILNQPIPETLNIEGIGEYEQPKCPSCQSLDVSYRELNKLVSYGSAYVGLPIPVHHTGWYCHSCHHEWEPEGTGAQESSEGQSESRQL